MATAQEHSIRGPALDRAAAWSGFAGAVLVQSGVLMVACGFLLDNTPDWLPGAPAALLCGVAGLALITLSRLQGRQARTRLSKLAADACDAAGTIQSEDRKSAA